VNVQAKELQPSPKTIVDPVAKAQSDHRLLEKISDFLLAHRLDPAPANYLLAYQVITRTNPAAVAAVEQATSGGVRLSQRDADRIAADSGVRLASAAEPATGSAAQAVEDARRQLDDVERIVSSSHAHAERYGRDLQSSAAELNACSIKISLKGLLQIIAGMIERTKDSEKQLQRRIEEIQTLKRELASASEEARTDALTGLPNRRALEDRYESLQKAGVRFSAAVADIDNFKTINDRHGHAVGDRVLRAVAHVLETSCSGHMVSRFGGEEFVVLLEHTGTCSAAALVDAARCDVAQRRFKLRETDDEIGAVTLSAGVAEARAGETWMELLMRADGLLYQAKAEGRNRVNAEQTALDADGE
jgi:diguanylate cyclase